MNVTILLADDHHVVREGLRALLEAEPDFEVVGEAADGLEAVQMTVRLKPAVVLLDLMMPGLNGLEVTRQVSRQSPQTRILILSMHGNEAYVLEALRNGANGYLLKESRKSEMVQAVREVAAGRRYLSTPLSQRAIDTYLETREASLDPYETLTTREREVLQLAAEGNTNAEIADRLSISPRTVEVHRANLMRKLVLSSQADMVLYAAWKGIIPLER